MVNKAVSFVVFRIVLPFALVAAVICRQNALSLCYLLLLLGAPVVSLPSPKTMAGNTGRYLKLTVGISLVATVAQIIFQVVLLSLPPYGDFITNCTNLEVLLRHLGFQRYDNVDPLQAARLIGPDILMLVVSVLVYVPLARAAHPSSSLQQQQQQQQKMVGEGGETESPPEHLDNDGAPSAAKKQQRRITLLSALGDVIALVLLAAAGIARPSLAGAVYFLSFLAVATWLACYKKLRRRFAVVRVALLVFAGAHLLVLYLYQLPVAQKILPPGSLYARLFGLEAMIVSECAEPRNIIFADLEWATYVNPALILALYWVLVMETKLWMESPLLSVDTAGQNYSTVGGDGDRMEIDPNGSVIFSHESNVDTDIAPSEDARRLALGRLRELISPLTSIFLLITRQSYIATLIVMMAYSITYHSWLTFVLLLWSCLLWMMPNSRKACLRSSPYIIAYAQGLLIIQYIYGLNLNDEELPTKIVAVNLQQIGLVKYDYLPCLPLTVKILYTVMFWITLRQYMEERYHEKNRDIVEGVMMQPFNMALNTTQSGDAKFDMQRQISMQSSPFMKRLGDCVLKFLTTYWIWVVACMLMVISLEGEKVVIFRIMYMALFLFFILIFQLSYRLWRATMYFFWLTVIIYSMLVLILIYTYQFENFPLYWHQYLGISKKLQRDIGLEVYDTGQLFLKLVPPTFFVVITIIQLHYFHKEFLRMSDIDTDGRRDVETSAPLNSNVQPPSTENNLANDPVCVLVVGDQNEEAADAPTEKSYKEAEEMEGGGMEQKVRSETSEQAVRRERPSVKLSCEERPVLVSLPSTPTPDKAQYVDLDLVDDDGVTKEQPSDASCLKDTLLTYAKDLMQRAGEFCDTASEFGWRFLEIHMTKIVLFAALMLAVYDVCTIHVVFVFLVTAALPFRPIQLFVSHCCSVWSSVLLLSKMIYQIDYVEEVWTVNCTEIYNVNESLPVRYPFNDTVNNAHWMGYYKVANLPNYLKGYIGLIVVLSVQAVVRVRQNYHRSQVGGPEPKPGVVFQDIKRRDADDGLVECAKYLINYAFYKFGTEICFMTTTAVIGVRLDICAVVYSLWLAALFLLKRNTLARVWPFYVTFLAILLPIQYCLCVGMPPGFCIDYPWSIDFMFGELREWLFLPDFTKPLAAYKLAVDFFQLMFACCQLFVFQIEASPIAEDYEGGTNREIIYIEKDEPEENTIPDFVTYTKSYLDLFKVVIFSLFYWVTLAIIFLAGTNRVSLFAMGYVIGCFLFLWNGQDFYLKPLKTILKLWNTLLAYNIFVIFIKTLLQMVGCVYIERVAGHFCWAIQLFGIACLKKFDRQYATITKLGECSVPEDEAGLLWDGICLGFMLMQRRLFSSYYFHHLVVEMHAQARLASRGAELINQLLMKEVQEQDAAERELVEKIKKKMDRIRANQQKIRGKDFAEPQEHFQAIRSGDYFMFEEYSDNDGLADLEYTDKKSDDKEDDPGGMTVSKLLSSAMKSDIKQAVSEAKQVKGGQSPDTGVSGRTSSGPTDASGRPPISRTVSAVSGASSLPVGMSVSRQASLRSQGYAELDRPPAFRMLHPMDDGRSYDDDGGQSSRSPPLPDLEGHLKVPGQGQLADEEEADEAVGQKESWLTKLINWLRFAWAFVEGLMVSATNRLNAISKDYRYVARCLAKEKQLLKEKGLVNAQSLKSAECVEIQSPPSQFPPLIKTLEEPLEIRVEKASEDQIVGSLECVDTPEQLEKEFEKEQPVAIRLVVALWYALVSRSEIVCYVMIVYNQIKSASLLSLPLPFMAFVWGSLSIPRPTKTFWITIITYTEAVVVIKYIFQFEFFPWNGDPVQPIQPFWPPRIIGLEKKEQYAVFDLALLMIIFFHRFILKSLGLWKDETDSSQSVGSEEAIESKSTDDKSKKSCDDIMQSGDSADLDEVDLDEYPDVDTRSHALECMKHYIRPFQRFFHNLFHPSYRVTVDVYAFMFLCDFSTFLILVFGYSAFGTGGSDGGVASYFEDNKVPVPFLVMLIAQFGLIIIDRALFLRKFILGKVAFQIAMVFVVHLWMFFVLPAVTEREFNATGPPQLWYFVKCIYLLLAAYQIRSGYPTRILGNFLTKKYNYLNMFLFRGFMAVPFLFELRAMMDWIWTDTSMSLSSWLKMEDIFCNIFILKCQRRAEAEYPTPRGEKRNPFNKYGVGGSLLFVIIFIIWFPLVLFALGNTVGVPNQPYDVTIDIAFGGYQPIFKMSAQHGALKELSKKQYNDLMYSFRRNRNAAAFLQNFDERDIVVAELSGNSTAVWGISPPSQKQLIDDLLSVKNAMTLKLSWHVSRVSTNPDVLATQSGEVSQELTETIRRQFAIMLNASAATTAAGSAPPIFIHVPDIFPKYVKVPGRAKSVPVKSLSSSFSESGYGGLNMSLRTGTFLNSAQKQEWWEVREDCVSSIFPVAPFSRDCNFLRLVTINDKMFPTTLSILSGYGIVGMYTTLVLLASRFVRGLFAGVSFHIMFDDMPYVDRVLQLCLDIYLVRESGELHLEEDLFAKLIFLYRSPETLIKWTRFPQRPNSP